ncbi:MAG TPA: cadherin-like beta sandwich domain-containing protein [Caproiciproducens sp.]|nr:cadherin-like beta sandwich domain-containing protein [Caproiciproducens sp.]
MRKNPVGQKALSLLLSFALVFGVFSLNTAGAFAAQSSSPTKLYLDSGNIVITDSGYFVGGGTKQNTPVGGYFITQSNDTTPNTISVTGSGICTQDITIQSVNINISGTPNACAFSIAKGARVNLTLEGQNMLKSGQTCAGLEVPGDSSAPEDPAKNASLTITADSTGMLTATGGEFGAGIGGNKNGTCGSITINGGTITATASGSGGAGIGGGAYSNGNNIMINGGTVTAIGRDGGAGIGGGGYGTGGTITVTGGIIMATGRGGGAGIGGGDYSDFNNIMISGGTVTANSITGGAGIGGGSGGRGGNIQISGGTVTANGGDSAAGIGGGFDGAGGVVNIFGEDTQVTAKGLSHGKDIGSGDGGTDGGSLAVSNGATVALLGSGTTNASAPTGVPMYANCQIITNGSETAYDTSGAAKSLSPALLTSTLTAKPAAGGAMELTASVSPAEAGTFTFAYCGAKDSGIIIRDVPIVNGAASTTWTNPPVHGLTVITAKYKASGYDALKATYSYNPDYNPDGAIDLSTVHSDGYGYTYVGTGHIITLMNSGTYTFTGSTRGTTANKIVVQTGVSADVTLRDANIDASTIDACPFSIEANASVNLTLTGTNTLQGGTNYAALGVPAGACLTVTEQSSGTLDAAVHSNSTTLGAGIGGCGHGTGTIIINGGRITANGRNIYNGYGAGIGGGAGDAGGSITINGGTVTATSCYGAGIGGGGSNYTGGAGGIITINRGTVTAQSVFGAGIGGGDGDDTGGAGGTVIINGGKITADGSNGSNGGISAGIGGGYGGNTGGAGGTVTVNGGFVTAKHGSNSRDIGGGTSGVTNHVCGGGAVGADGTNAFQGGSIAAGSVSPQPVVSTGSFTKVYKTSAQIPGVSAETPVTCTANGHSFSTQSDAQGFLYVWLPESAAASYSILNESTAISYLAKGTVNPAASVNPLSVFCTDTGLNGMTVRGQPAVFSGTDTYSCSFGNSVAALVKSDFVPTFHGMGDTWKLFGDSSCTQELSSLPLNAGENTAYLKVTAQDGTTSKTYQLQITRGTSSNANLAGLSVKANGENVPLSPAFGADILNYTANVGSGVSELTVTPAVSEPSAAFAVNGKTPAVGQTSVNITLNEAGQTTPISVKVTAQDGTTMKIYTLNIVRAASSTPIPTPSNSSGGSSHGTTTPSLPASLTDTPTNTTIDLSGAAFPAWVTGVSLSVLPEAAGNAPSAPGNAGIPSDPQGAAVYHLAITQTGLNLIGSPFVYNIKLLDQNGNPITSFTGSVTVKVAIPAGIHGTPHIFRYEESTGAFTDMKAAVENGFLVFATDHFSYYVIAGTGDSITLDTSSYSLSAGGQYQIGVRLTGGKAATVKVCSTNDKVAAVTELKNGNVQVIGARVGKPVKPGSSLGTAYIMFDVYDHKNHLLSHASVKIDVKTGIRPRGDSARQIGIF